ncbi:hypothetical protein P4B35_17370 [Pontiellaceae bacterium B12227]|nr:hypothetical protein [Pontiellaceae bacterium B12227]
MKMPRLEDMNSPRFLQEAFEKEHRLHWLKNARIRRNVYLWLFIVGMICMLYTALTQWMTLSILSLFLAIVSLVVMSKYDTQLCFLNILQMRDEQKNRDPDHS